MSVEQKIYNIDLGLSKLYKRRDRLMAEIEQRPEIHRLYRRYSSLITEIRIQLRLKMAYQEGAGNKRLKDWLKAEHPEIYEKFFGSKEELDNE